MKIEVHSVQETRDLAQKIADQVQGRAATIALNGDLGAGKTTFTKALAKALGVKNTVNSPTFTIMKPYKMADGRPLYHIDAYRLEGIVQDLGFEDLFEEGITVVEWGAFIQDQLPEERIEITIRQGEGESRTFEVEGLA